MSKIITISREFGSGGREIGKRLSDQLGIGYFDSEIIKQISEKTGLSEQYIESIYEKGPSSYPISFGRTFYSNLPLQNNQTEVFVAQQKIIKEITKNGDCIIVGRGADIILKQYNPMKLFIYANMQAKIERCYEKAHENENLTQKEMEKKIVGIDKNRKKYYSLLSNQIWGDKNNYQLCINTSDIEIKDIIPSLSDYIESWFRRNI